MCVCCFQQVSIVKMSFFCFVLCFITLLNQVATINTLASWVSFISSLKLNEKSEIYIYVLCLLIMIACLINMRGTDRQKHKDSAKTVCRIYEVNIELRTVYIWNHKLSFQQRVFFWGVTFVILVSIVLDDTGILVKCSVIRRYLQITGCVPFARCMGYSML